MLAAPNLVEVPSTLDDLLDRVCGQLHLTEPLHRQACVRYEGVGSWLLEPGTRLARGRPTIFPQGSLRLGTTVRPRGKNEFDLDLVCQFEINPLTVHDPLSLLNAVEARLRESPAYGRLIERKKRCVRLVYANEFHMDILPACPDYGGPEGALLVPDRDVRDWKASNPKGFAAWFERRSVVGLRKAVLDGLEPVPALTNPAAQTPLHRLVQLFKRWRDVAFAEHQDLAPISIVLTTLAGTHYSGDTSIAGGFLDILAAIVRSLPSDGRLRVCNPANALEDLSERWEDREIYEAFVAGVRRLHSAWHRVVAAEGLEELVTLLGCLFGEDVVARAVKEQAEYVQGKRASSLLTVVPSRATIAVTSAGHRPIPRNTFYGRD